VAPGVDVGIDGAEPAAACGLRGNRGVVDQRVQRAAFQPLADLRDRAGGVAGTISFDAQGELAFSVGADAFLLPSLGALLERLLDRLNSLPGASSASMSLVRVLSGAGTGWSGSVDVEGYTYQPEDRQAYFNAIGPRYFRTLGTPVLMGREFDKRDIAF